MKTHAAGGEKMYVRILRAFVLLVAVFIMLTSALLYITSDNIVTELTYRNNRQMLDESYHRISSAFTKAYTLTSMIYSDPDISYALYEETFQPNKLMRTANRLNAYREMEKSIYSIYVYNGRTQQVMVSGPRHASINDSVFGEDANFFDTGLGDIILNLSSYSRGLPIARVVSNVENCIETEYEGYTFFFSQGYDPAHISNVFVNYNVDLFELKQAEGNILLVDGSGRVIAGNTCGMNYSIADSGEVWNEISSEGTSRDSFRAVYEGEDVLVTYTDTNFGDGWKLIKIMPFARISAEITYLRRLVMLITVLVFAIGITATWITSRYIYVPIRNMNRRLDEANEENEQLRRLSRQQLMRRLLAGELADENRLAAIRSYIHGKTLRIVHMRCLNYREIRDGMTPTAYQAWVRGIVSRMENELSQRYSVLGLDMHSGREYVLMMAGSSQLMEDDVLLSSVAVAQGHTEEASKASFRMIISSGFTDMSQINQMYSQLQDADFRSMCRPEIHRIFEEQIPEADDEHFDYQMSRESQLNGMLLSEQFDQASALTHEILSESFGCSFYIMDMTVARLTFVYINVLKLLMSRYDIQADGTIPEQFHLSRMESTDELCAYFDGLLMRTVALSREKKSSRTQDIVRKVNEFLEKNLGDCTINLDAVAEPIGMSAAYVSRIYKISTGVNITEALNRLRIDKAKELLRNQRQLTVANISELTGFTSNTYFSRAFKKDTGMTPNEYRNAQRENV